MGDGRRHSRPGRQAGAVTSRVAVPPRSAARPLAPPSAPPSTPLSAPPGEPPPPFPARHTRDHLPRTGTASVGIPAFVPFCGATSGHPLAERKTAVSQPAAATRGGGLVFLRCSRG